MEWKSIDMAPDYEVSSTGLIRRKAGKKRKIRVGSSGYPSITLSINGRSKTVPIHRIVAMAFLPNPENKKTVNHIDGNKQNNDVTNLEWATYRENYEHASKVLKVGMHGLLVDQILVNKLHNLLMAMEKIKKRPECTRALEEYINRAIRQTINK